MEFSPLVGCSILVVEQEPFIARCLRGLLEGAGAEVDTAGNAAEALHFVDQGTLSVAVLDYATSEQDKHRIPERLSGLGIPFVFCASADSDKIWRHRPTLMKPVLGIELVQTVRALLTKASATAAGDKARNSLVEADEARAALEAEPPMRS